MALSKEESTQETTNLACIAQIILGPCTSVLQDVLAKEMLPKKLQKKIEAFLDKRHIRLTWLKKDEGREVFSTIKENPYFNIPLLYACLRCMRSIPPHKNKWGNFPEDQDRSLSANIERIYSLHKEYGHYPNYHLNDLIFEHDWKNAYETVKELEEHLGSDTKHQENINELKTCSMKPQVGEKVINRLWESESVLADIILESKNIPGGIYEATIYKEAEDKAISITRLREKSESEESVKSGSESELADFILESEEFPGGIYAATIYKKTEDKAISIKRLMEESESEENVKPERTEPVTSKQLKELFNSFEIKIPPDPQIESFASGIVHKDVNNLVTTVNSLSHGVVLPTNTPSNTVLIFEMEVVYDYEQLWVVKKNNSPYAFQMFLDEDNPTKVILITSKSLPIVKAKLTVYKKFKHVINEKKIFLQHEHEEFDDVAKLIAYQKVMKFCVSVESVINAFSGDLYQIVTDYEGRPLTANTITEMCLNAFNESEQPWDLTDPRSFSSEMLPKTMRLRRDWRVWVATKIHQKISKKGEMECTDAWTEIWNACQQTVEDLGTILSGLEEFRTRVVPVDQNKQIDEWLKREIIEDEASLRKYPSIIRWVAGQRDDKNVVKVYLSGGNTEEAKKAFKEKCKLKNADFEFVNIVGKKGMPKEIKEIKALEREAPAIDKSALKELKKIVREHTDKLYARYSNINGIRIGVHGDTQPCIILYCFDKTLIPFGEKKLPETLAGWPCDVREKFTMFGMCTQNCSADPPELGCSIGIKSNAGSGSAGFMYESKNSDKYRSGFLTASHVAIKDCHRLNKESTLLSNHPLGNYNHIIVHPSRDDNGGVDHPVGVVVESFFGNFESSQGLDFAAIKTNKIREGEKETVAIYNEDDGIAMESVEVMKTGRTTAITFGQLDQTNEEDSIRLYHPPQSDNWYPFEDVYVVQNNLGEAFFEPGDSGSGVFVVEKTEEGNKPGKALGILFAGTCSEEVSSEEVSSEEAFSKEVYPEEAYVCKIAKILDTLGLKIVR